MKITKSKVKGIVILQSIVIIYSLSGVTAKYASGFDLLSWEFFIFYGLEILILGIYAILWQQVIKQVDISVAYSNRSIALLWSMVWAVIFFNESYSLKNIIGLVIVITGTVVVNSDEY